MFIQPIVTSRADGASSLLHHLTPPSRNSPRTHATYQLRADCPVLNRKNNDYMPSLLNRFISLSDIFRLQSAPRIYALGFELGTA